ncbi:MAG TPA: dihydrodipicolinate synthase family protein [Anaerolineae bacterium]|nr:dihydrodipicolinate synthase family protein [Anaerolineae bacterium]
MQKSVFEQRQAMIRRLIGPRMPRLWCPPITHYLPSGMPDAARQAAHWRTMMPYVGGFLVPGSTGDGWRMTEPEIDVLLDVTLDLAALLDTRLLIGVLREDVAAMLETITRVLIRLKARTGADDALTALIQARVCGFTVCPPCGADLTQAQIKADLEAVLDLDLPVALYQLPQVTQNEMSPELVFDLAARYPNFFMFKDTSGADRVASAGGGQGGLFLMRGAEGDYARWLLEADGPYHGLLLSSANCFPARLGEMITLLESGMRTEAQALSNKLKRAVSAVFALVSDWPYGSNSFAEANKLMDHWMAYGPDARVAEPPMIHSGLRLPVAMIAATGEILDSFGLLPKVGYWKN